MIIYMIYHMTNVVILSESINKILRLFANFMAAVARKNIIP